MAPNYHCSSICISESDKLVTVCDILTVGRFGAVQQIYLTQAANVALEYSKENLCGSTSGNMVKNDFDEMAKIGNTVAEEETCQ